MDGLPSEPGILGADGDDVTTAENIKEIMEIENPEE